MSKGANAFDKAATARQSVTIELEPEAAQWLASVAEAMTYEAGELVTPEMIASGIVSAEYLLAEEQE